jgi:hypothetical protein
MSSGQSAGLALTLACGHGTIGQLYFLGGMAMVSNSKVSGPEAAGLEASELFSKGLYCAGAC